MGLARSDSAASNSAIYLQADASIAGSKEVSMLASFHITTFEKLSASYQGFNTMPCFYW